MMEIATDRVRPAVQSYRGAKQGLRISREVSERLRGMSRREGVTMFMSLLAGFKAMLMRYSGQDGHSGRNIDSGKEQAGDGGVDRVFRKHVGDEDGRGR